MLIDHWLSEMHTSALPKQVKEMACYLTIAQILTAQKRQASWTSSGDMVFPLHHVKTISMSCILVGKPGSYKSEAVRFIHRVLDRYSDRAMKTMNPHKPPVYIYPYDQCTREYLCTCLSERSKEVPEVQVTMLIDELVNFLNKREYVEPLIGTLNSLLDQPPKYNVGTQKRKSELITKPIGALIAACAPGWFQYLPVALFTGGFAGRCMFYGVPYPRDEDRQPMGSICGEGAEERLGELLYYMTHEPLTLDSDASKIYMEWERLWGKEDAHPLEAIDEWYKRRAIQVVRLASCIGLSRDRHIINPEDMYEANFHMTHIQNTLESVWEELDGDYPTRYKMFRLQLIHQAYTLTEIEHMAIKYLRTPSQAHSTIDWWVNRGILCPVEGGKWIYKG